MAGSMKDLVEAMSQLEIQKESTPSSSSEKKESPHQPEAEKKDEEKKDGERKEEEQKESPPQPEVEENWGGQMGTGQKGTRKSAILHAKCGNCVAIFEKLRNCDAIAKLQCNR